VDAFHGDEKMQWRVETYLSNVQNILSTTFVDADADADANAFQKKMPDEVYNVFLWVRSFIGSSFSNKIEIVVDFSKHQMQDLLSCTAFDYESNTEEYHNERYRYFLLGYVYNHYGTDIV
jgi:hypothetical protein